MLEINTVYKAHENNVVIYNFSNIKIVLCIEILFQLLL